MPHVSDELLARLADGALAEEEFDRWLDHLEHCARCADRFDSLGGIDGTLSALAQRAATVTLPDEAACRVMMSRLSEQLDTQARRQNRLPPTLPESIGPYRITDILGVGGMGIVYEGEHEWLRRRVAIKTLPQREIANLRMLERFGDEFRWLAQLDHPGIVRAIDAGRQSEAAYFVMEKLDGLTWSEVSGRLGPIEVPEVAAMVCSVAEALSYAHENGFVHHDIKPSNLMLARQIDGTVRVKVLDLGMADWVSVSSRRGDPRRRHSGGGTVGYAAPEQLAGEVVDARCDIYALGVTAAALMSGRKSPSEAIDWLSKPASSVGEVAVTSRVRSLLRGMTEALPEARPGDMKEVESLWRPVAETADPARLLQRAAAQAPSETQTSWDILTTRTVAQLVTSPNSRARRWWPLALASAVAGVVLVGWLIWRPIQVPVTFASDAISERRLDGRVDTERTEQPNVSSRRGGIDAASIMKLNRDLAHEILALGGRLDAKSPSRDNTIQVSRVDRLPEEPFVLTWAMLDHTEVDDELLLRMSRLNALVGITLSYTAVTDRGVAALGEVETLANIYLYQTDVGDDGVAPLTQLPDLEELVVSETAITDATLRRLAGCLTLQRLTVKGTSITGSSMRHVATLKNLRQLDLRETAVDDDGLRRLTGLNQLFNLELQHTTITPPGLRPLLSLPRLRSVSVSPEYFPDAAVEQLRESHDRITFIVDTP